MAKKCFYLKKSNKGDDFFEVRETTKEYYYIDIWLNGFKKEQLSINRKTGEMTLYPLDRTRLETKDEKGNITIRWVKNGV